MFCSKNATLPFMPQIDNRTKLLDDNECIHVSYLFGDNPVKNVLGDATSIHDIFKSAVNSHGNSPCLGSHSSLTEPYIWLTYAEVYERIRKFGSGLLHRCALVPGKGHCVGIFSINCPEWLICKFACVSYNLICVPMYDSLEITALQHICNEAEISVIICDSMARVKKLLSLQSNMLYLKKIITILPSATELESLRKEFGSSIELITFESVLGYGEQHIQEVQPSRNDELVLICYTSGTTGLPKGVMIPNKMMLSALNSNIVNVGPDIVTENDTHFSYLPLTHIFEQMIVLLALYGRSRVGFYSGDVRNLSKDAIVLKPTIFVAVPRVLTRIYEGVQDKIGTSRIKRYIFNTALNAKCWYTDRHIFSKVTIWDTLVFSKIRDQLGGKVKVIISGGAPMPSNVTQFIRAVFSCPVCEGYGSTETCAAFTAAMSGDLGGGHVGAPVPGMQIKLVDIPEMEIVAARDNKGEICCRGANCTPGYYKDPQRTATLIDSDGWLHTGDIGIWTEDTSLMIVDRCKHIFKLSQSEYVSPENVERVYQMSQFVSQVFVDGDAHQRYPIAIILPNFQILAETLNRQKAEMNSVDKLITPSLPSSGDWEEHFLVKGRQLSMAELCKLPEANKLVLADLTRLGKMNELNGYEQVHSIILIADPFSINNRMMTPTMKYARGMIRQEYADAIKNLYLSSTPT